MRDNVKKPKKSTAGNQTNTKHLEKTKKQSWGLKPKILPQRLAFLFAGFRFFLFLVVPQVFLTLSLTNIVSSETFRKPTKH